MSNFDDLNVRVILQFGKHSIKAGLAGDCLPRTMLCTDILRGCEKQKCFNYTLTKEDWTEKLSPIIRAIYFEKLKVTPSLNPVLLLEHEFAPSTLREAIASVLFDELQVPSIFYMSEMASPLYLTGVGTGLVIDIGYYDTRVLPVAYETLIREAYQEVRLGSYHVNKVLIRELKEQDADLTEKMLDKIKAAACYVKCEKDDILSYEIYSDKDVSYKASDDKEIIISKELRWMASEALFGFSKDNDNLIDTVIKSLTLCNSELRARILKNIVLCGGGSQLKGFMFRFAYEFKKRMDEIYPKLTSNAKFCNAVCPEVCRQWVGASVCSYTVKFMPQSIFEIELNERKQGKRLPDWILGSFLDLKDRMLRCNS